MAAFVRERYLSTPRSRVALERRQRRLLKRHLRYLRAHSAYFSTAPLDPERLHELPIADKATMMAHFDDMSTVGIARDEAMTTALASERDRDFGRDIDGHSIGLSSGTSGHRGLFVVSPGERARWAGTMLARTLPRGRSLLAHRIALFLRADNSLYESVASRAISFEYFDIYRELESQVVRLAAYRPTVLVAPPSVLVQIAAVGRRLGLDIAPERVISVAEVLDELDRARIAEAFGVAVVHQIYQCTEGFLGHTCELGSMHLNEDTVLVEREWLDDGRFVPIVTDLVRRAQPIVRYRMGDVLVAGGPCGCGSALAVVERIEGREDDALVGRRTDGSEVTVFGDQIVRAMLFVDGLEDFRVCQTGADEVVVRVAPLTDVTGRAAREELHGLFERMGCTEPRLTVEGFVPDLGTKQRRVTREWDHDEGM